MTTEEKIYIADLFKARFPFMYIASWEENRIVEALLDIVSDADMIHTVRKVYAWGQTTGFLAYQDSQFVQDTEQPIKALEFIEKCDEPAIFILKDFHVYFGAKGSNTDYALIRKCRDLVGTLKLKNTPQNIIFLAPSIVLPESLQKDVVVYDFELPSFDDIHAFLDEMIEVNKDNDKIKITINEDEKNQLCRAALGLTYQEAENAFARAMVHGGCLSIDDLSIINEEECQVIRKTEILEYIKTDIKIDDVGGLENLKKWLEKRNKSWLQTARDYSLPAPKGILITGVPGCGKSLCAKAMSAAWQLPLLRLDMGKIFSGIVGSSEENMRKAIKTAEAVAPCILWIDEIEKGLSNTRSSGDSGTSARIFGTFLTWMQEKEKPVFVVATSNDISSLPAELLRKGRFDEIFFVDLPTLSERKDIFSLHLKKRLINEYVARDIVIDEKLLNELAELTEGYSGAEIEQIIIEALFEAYYNERPLLPEDIKRAINNSVALSITQSEQIFAIRRWAGSRAVAASAKKDVEEYQMVEAVEKNETEKENISNIAKARGGRFVDF